MNKSREEPCDEVKDDGGFAFACVDGQNKYLQEGMTLRDYFAAAALQGILAGRSPETARFTDDGIVSGAYRMADAMLSARQRKER